MQLHRHEGQPWIRRGFPTANPRSCLPLRSNLVRSSVGFRGFFLVWLRFSRRGRILVGESLLRPTSLTMTQPLGDSETLSSVSFNFRFRWNREAIKFCLPEGVETRVSHRTWLAPVCPVVRECAPSKGQQGPLNAVATAAFTAAARDHRAASTEGDAPPRLQTPVLIYF